LNTVDRVAAACSRAAARSRRVSMRWAACALWTAALLSSPTFTAQRACVITNVPRAEVLAQAAARLEAPLHWMRSRS
jgi:hypothetical protein